MTPGKILALAVFVLGIFQTSCNRSPQSEAWRALMRLKAEDYFSDPLQVRLAKAVAGGKGDQIADAIKQGADVNAQGREGMTPLFWALSKDSPDAFRALLEHGANPNVSVESLISGERPRSVMELVSIAEDAVYLRLALNHQGNANFPVGYGDRTIIYEAIMNNRTENVRILAEWGADLAHRDIAGETPMATAASIDDYDIVYLLLEKGADPSIRDRWGYDLARLIKMYGTRGIKPDSEQYKWYLKVVAEMKKRGML